MIRRPPRSTQSRSSAASDVYKRQVIELLATASNLMITLSRLSEELILWSTSEFGYMELDDKFASTSSIMPQKKNPDPLELTRAKTRTVIGALTASLVICKALPYSYNLDLQ